MSGLLARSLVARLGLAFLCLLLHASLEAHVPQMFSFMWRHGMRGGARLGVACMAGSRLRAVSDVNVAPMELPSLNKTQIGLMLTAGGFGVHETDRLAFAQPGDGEQPDSPPPAAAAEDEEVQHYWYVEHKGPAEIKARLHSSTASLALRDIFHPSFVDMIEDTSLQANCHDMFIGTMMLPTVGAAMGPNVRATAWHSRTSGWFEVANVNYLVAAPSGTGKTNAARVLKREVSSFEKACGINIKSTGYTLASLKTRLCEHKQAMLILEEARSCSSPHPCRAAPPALISWPAALLWAGVQAAGCARPVRRDVERGSGRACGAA